MKYVRPVVEIAQNQAPARCVVPPATVQVKFARCDKRYSARWYRFPPALSAMDKVKRLPPHAIPVLGEGWCVEPARKLYPSQPVWIMATKSVWQGKGSLEKMAVRMGTFISSLGS